MIVDFILLVKMEINIFLHCPKMMYLRVKNHYIKLTSIVRLGEKYGDQLI